MCLRWKEYFLRKNEEFDKFWKKYLEQSRDILFILGQGFDPRMCIGLEAILKNGGAGLRDCILVNFIEGENSPSVDFRQEVEQNMEELERLLGGKDKFDTTTINMESEDGHRIGARRAAEIFNSFSSLEKYSDIIIDISSLPFNIYFTLIGKTLFLLDKAKKEKKEKIPNLHVIVSENTNVDKSIRKSGLSDDASYLFGFTGNLESISKEEDPTVWVPVLGEGQREQIELIENLISPKEICPVLPSPSFYPRRGDNIMLEYGDLLMNRLRIEFRNIIYGSEQNPFELYRQIQKTIEHYRDALKPLGDCKFALSSLSSKLMSMGVFLVAYEEGLSEGRNVGIAYVESKGYSMKKGATNSKTLKDTELFSLWISGDCYS